MWVKQLAKNLSKFNSVSNGIKMYIRNNCRNTFLVSFAFNKVKLLRGSFFRSSMKINEFNKPSLRNLRLKSKFLERTDLKKLQIYLWPVPSIHVWIVCKLKTMLCQEENPWMGFRRSCLDSWKFILEWFIHSNKKSSSIYWKMELQKEFFNRLQLKNEKRWNHHYLNNETTLVYNLF